MRLVLTVLAAAATLAAQQPSFTKANVQPAAASGGLEKALRTAIAEQKGPAWVGYAVPTQPGMGQSCCWNDSNRGCGLEGGHEIRGARNDQPVKLEGPTHASVLYRVENGSVGKIAAYSMDCPLDAGGLTVHWLTGVGTAESVATLARYATGTGRMIDGALHAITMHAGAEADVALERLASPEQEVETRKKAIFWLGNSRGRRGYEAVSRAAREDPSDKVREHAIFALTLTKEQEAIPTIIRIAREDKSPHVRGQALFWLAQKASQKAGAAITDSIDRDPDTEVKKAAVFALTQLPHDEGVPALIQVARNNRNPAVRKQAMFWLGQSKDERALKFLEDVLTR